MKFRNPWIDPRVVQVRPAAAQAYLRAHGWMVLPAEQPNLLSFRGGDGGEDGPMREDDAFGYACRTRREDDLSEASLAWRPRGPLKLRLKRDRRDLHRLGVGLQCAGVLSAGRSSF